MQDQHGSRFIQQRLEVSSDVDKQVRVHVSQRNARAHDTQKHDTLT